MEEGLKIAQRAGRTVQCPKCAKPLIVAIEEGWEVDFCNQCKGIWVDVWEEKELLRIKPEAFTMDELKRLHAFYKPLGKADPVRYVPCPVCKELMNRKIWGSYSGIIIDKCYKHGTWYDDGELTKIQEYVASGGIEYEKMAMMEDGFNAVNSKLTSEVSRINQKLIGIYSRSKMAQLYSLSGF